jgi:spore germination protein
MKLSRMMTALAMYVVVSTVTVWAQRPESMFYLIDNEDCFLSFKVNIKNIDIAGPQSYRMDEHGIIFGAVDSRIMDLARSNGVRLMPLVMNTNFDQPAFHAFLHDSLARTRAVTAMLRLCKENNYYGIQFDYENIHIRDKDLFTGFYREAAATLHTNGYAVSVAVVPRTSDNAGPTEYHKWMYEYWRGAYDYKALGEIGDFISLMTYDQHTHRTPPGPVAGIPWMEEVIQFVLQGVPSSKISLGLPFYSYRWQPAYINNQAHVWGRSLDYKEAIGIADRFHAHWRWDDREKVSYTFYSNEGLNEYMYLEDAASFAAKMELVKRYRFRGYSVWRLGHEDPEVWEQIQRERSR